MYSFEHKNISKLKYNIKNSLEPYPCSSEMDWSKFPLAISENNKYV